MIHFRHSHWLFSSIWHYTWQVTTSDCCCPPAPWCIEHSPVCSPLRLLLSWSILEIEASSTKPTHFHRQRLESCKKPTSPEHQKQWQFASTRDAASKLHFKNTHPVLSVREGQSTLLKGLCHLVAAEGNLLCHRTRRTFPRADSTASRAWGDGYKQPPVGNTSTTPVHQH